MDSFLLLLLLPEQAINLFFLSLRFSLISCLLHLPPFPYPWLSKVKFKWFSIDLFAILSHAAGTFAVARSQLADWEIALNSRFHSCCLFSRFPSNKMTFQWPRTDSITQLVVALVQIAGSIGLKFCSRSLFGLGQQWVKLVDKPKMVALFVAWNLANVLPKPLTLRLSSHRVNTCLGTHFRALSGS